MALDRTSFKRNSIIIYAVVLTAFTAWWIIFPPVAGVSAGDPRTVKLERGPFQILDFPSKRWKTDAVVLFGSGDGGWGGVEEAISRALQEQGIEVIGIDSAAYAQTDYNLQILQADYDRMAQSARSFHAGGSPVIIGGYSMGAAQAIAASGGPHPPRGAVGTLLVDPLSRGRYGLRMTDRLNVLPTGNGTFSMKDFSAGMGKLRVVQWHASGDSIDSSEWLESLAAPHKELVFFGADHSYGYDRAEFVRQLVQSVDWILNPHADAAASSTRLGETP